MTNEEKAKELADFLYFKLSHIDYRTLNEKILEMAAWKEQQMIEKAVKWMKDNIMEYLECEGYSECPGFKMYVTDDFYDDFKQAMMEE